MTWNTIGITDIFMLNYIFKLLQSDKKVVKNNLECLAFYAYNKPTLIFMIEGVFS